MVGQQLAHTSQSSHRFAILLQFCLWDFLRSIGEDEVGGAGVLQSARDSEATSGEPKDIPLVKIQNVASAYAWWTCRGTATLSMLKVHFTIDGQMLSNIEADICISRPWTSQP